MMLWLFTRTCPLCAESTAGLPHPILRGRNSRRVWHAASRVGPLELSPCRPYDDGESLRPVSVPRWDLRSLTRTATEREPMALLDPPACRNVCGGGDGPDRKSTR